MSTNSPADRLLDLRKVVAQKKHEALSATPDTWEAWIAAYLEWAVAGVREVDMEQKIELHLRRWRAWYLRHYGHETLSYCLAREVKSWQKALQQEEATEGEKHPALAAATVNGHLASLSKMCRWVEELRPHFFQMGNPCADVEELPLPAPAPRTLSEAQYRSLKSTIARLPALYQRKGLQYIERQRKRQLGPALAARTRPYRDQAIIEALISCGLRREELVNLDLAQIELSAHQAESLTPELLRRAKQVELRHVRGKGNSLRNLYLSVDARYALAAYLERERPEDAAHFAAGSALFLRAWNAPSPSDPGASRSGRLANNTVNYIVAKVGRLHDAEQSDPARKLGRFHPHRLRHLFGFKLAASTGKDEPELRLRLGHRSTRYIQIYTNPPAEVAASYVEDF